MRSPLLLLVCVLAGCAASRPADKEPPADAPTRLVFAALGDMPYSAGEEALLTLPGGALVSALHTLRPSVLIHVGDFKVSSAACTDSLLLARKRLIEDLWPTRTVYTPGDNDWTDCDREALAERFDELERLDFLRTLFFDADSTDLSTNVVGLKRQDGFRENARWRIGEVVFGTLHIAGTNNGRKEVLMSDTTAALAAAATRDAFNEAWIADLFAAAASAQALVIAFQADIYHPVPGLSYQSCTVTRRVDCDGYKHLRDLLERRARNYGRPVLLIHGDTNAYCLHQPARGLAPNLWRLNAPGDYKYIDAARVVFNPDDTARPFTVSGLLDTAPAPAVCDYSY